jgi:hypothetical protein
LLGAVVSGVVVAPDWITVKIVPAAFPAESKVLTMRVFVASRVRGTVALQAPEALAVAVTGEAPPVIEIWPLELEATVPFNVTLELLVVNGEIGEIIVGSNGPILSCVIVTVAGALTSPSALIVTTDKTLSALGFSGTETDQAPEGEVEAVWVPTPPVTLTLALGSAVPVRVMGLDEAVYAAVVMVGAVGGAAITMPPETNRENMRAPVARMAAPFFKLWLIRCIWLRIN